MSPPRPRAGPRLRGIALVALLAYLPRAPLYTQEPTAAGGDPAADIAEPAVLPSGFGVGIAYGLTGLGGAANAFVQDAGTLEGFLRYGSASGLVMRIGAHVGRRRLQPVDFPYQLFGAYLEPRYVANGIAPTWAPFVMGQVAHLQESVAHGSMRLAATGVAVGGGGGVALQLWPQVAAEVGAVGGTLRFGDYVFRGERAWYQCLNGLEAGTALPQSVEQCADATDIAAVLCYPPFYPESATSISSDCVPPEIPYDGTARSGSFFRLWLGLHFSFTGPE
ncbi:MAG: hypothetical protein PVF27_04405 [Gemmatimonadales bacterium]|jgi:hypothetical protein